MKLFYIQNIILKIIHFILFNFACETSLQFISDYIYGIIKNEMCSFRITRKQENAQKTFIIHCRR